jgi:hypothetical protein
MLVARVDEENGLDVVCGSVGCIGQFGRIRRHEDSGICEFIMPNGWEFVEDEGSPFYRLNRHAQERVDQGKPPKSRRKYTDPQHPQGSGYFSSFPRLPADAICPVCRERNLLDAVALRINHPSQSGDHS